MDYLKLYKELIKTRQQREKIADEYYEKHHFLPKSIFNDEIARKTISNKNISKQDDPSNIVYLSAREHFVAHLLLVKIFENHSTNCYIKMLYAANLMKSRTNSSSSYEWFRKKYSEMRSKELIGKPSLAKGKKWSKEARKKKSENHPAKGKTYEEYYGKDLAIELKEKRSKSRLGRKHSKETLKKLRYKKTKEHCKKTEQKK